MLIDEYKHFNILNDKLTTTNNNLNTLNDKVYNLENKIDILLNKVDSLVLVHGNSHDNTHDNSRDNSCDNSRDNLRDTIHGLHDLIHDIHKSTTNMDNHISFVETIYETFSSPLYYIMNKFSKTPLNELPSKNTQLIKN
jgi:hypothetical protein